MDQAVVKHGVFPGRIEDRRFIKGEGRYTDDRLPADALHAAFVRSVHAHGRLISVDVSGALDLPGVVAVYTAEDLARDGVGPLQASIPLKRPNGRAAVVTPRPLLVGDTVRHLGEALAMVIAQSRVEAIDAAEAVAVEIEEYDAVSDPRQASAAVVWPDAEDNVAFAWRGGDFERARAAIEAAPHVVALDSVVTRVTAAAIEPRSALAEGDDEGRTCLRAQTQNPFALKTAICEALGFAPENLRVVVGDVGGSFGMKSGVYAEDMLVVYATRRLGRPVSWRSDRTESFLADNQGRDVHVEARLGLDEDGRFLALDVRYRLNIGAYVSSRSVNAINNSGGLAGVYKIGAIGAEATGILTNSVPVAPYRGAGRPEATYTIERLIDLAARRLGIDRFELRRRNLVQPEAMPYDTGLTFTYDVGDFPAIMEAGTERADLTGFAARRAASAGRGLLRGLGVALPIEVSAGPIGRLRPDHARMRLRPDGTIELVVGALSTGQGQETVLSCLAAERLGLRPDQIHYIQGDTDAINEGRGQGGSSGAPTAAPAVVSVGGAFVEAGRIAAARSLEADPADIDYAGGRFTVAGTDRAVGWDALAELPDDERPSADAKFLPSGVTYPYGCHLAEVEIDPETGMVRVDRYTAVEDLGRVLDATLVEGQMHGGIAQGLGQVLGEAIRFDAAGQMLTSSFLDYRMPRAADMPPMDLSTRDIPTAANPLGTKGVGEAGTIGSLAAISNAIADALAALGVDHVEMPATPERVWQAIREAKSA